LTGVWQVITNQAVRPAHGLAGLVILVASYVINFQGKMADAMGFSVE
jgi:hypothetical protein